MQRKKYVKLISACLLGIKCKYNGRSNLNKRAIKLFQKGNCLLACPEVCGGLPIPRIPCEILKGNGADVLKGKAKVFGKDGKDYTKYFIKGAKSSLLIAKPFKVKEAILKSRSPSCGKGKIYDGTFSGKLKKGEGVFTALLKKNKIKVKTEDEI